MEQLVGLVATSAIGVFAFVKYLIPDSIVQAVRTAESKNIPVEDFAKNAMAAIKDQAVSSNPEQNALLQKIANTVSTSTKYVLDGILQVETTTGAIQTTIGVAIVGGVAAFCLNAVYQAFLSYWNNSAIKDVDKKVTTVQESVNEVSIEVGKNTTSLQTLSGKVAQNTTAINNQTGKLDAIAAQGESTERLLQEHTNIKIADILEKTETLDRELAATKSIVEGIGSQFSGLKTIVKANNDCLGLLTDKVNEGFRLVLSGIQLLSVTTGDEVITKTLLENETAWVVGHSQVKPSCIPCIPQTVEKLAELAMEEGTPFGSNTEQPPEYMAVRASPTKSPEDA